MINSYLPLLFFIFIFSCHPQSNSSLTYVCTPCDLPCDELTFSEPGICPHCKMKLIVKENFVLNDINIRKGSGAFLIEGGKGNADKPIKVFYHKPENYQPDSKILIVIPGGGRNGDSYRDTWVAASEKYNLLILSLMYSEKDYDYGAYHLGNTVYDLNMENSFSYVENSNHVLLDEQKFDFKINTDRTTWLFEDFDRIFDAVVKKLNSNQSIYDIFGHSAGGQILHRLAIFSPDNKANRIIASNAGSYTLPDVNNPLPFGIKEALISSQHLKKAFEKQLVLYIGALDNENETGGLLLRSPSVDKQGLHRLARAEYFYRQSKNIAKENNWTFNWELQIIPGIGHDQEKMGKAAAVFLYDK